VKSYRVEEHFKDIFSDNDDDQQRSTQESPHDGYDDGDSDTFIPRDKEDEEQEEFLDEELGREEYEFDTGSGSEAATPSSSRRKRKSGPGPIPTAAATGLYTPRARVTRRRKPRDPKGSPGDMQSTGDKNDPNRMYTRGVDDWGRGSRGGGLEARVRDLFGPVSRDLKPIMQSRDWWLDQHTLPTRNGMPTKEGSMRRSFFVNEGAREKEIRLVREWYSRTGAGSFARGQKSRALTKLEAEPYLALAGASSLHLLLGTVQKPKLYSLQRGGFVSTADPFEKKEKRSGWIFNLGSKVQDAQWAPVEDGSIQYLAVAVEQKPSKAPHNRLETPQAPAFSPSPRFAASIQLWAFESLPDGSLDPAKSPRLEFVICADWGAPKELRWCPIAMSESAESEDGTTVRLGLLAVRWSDGGIRVLDISYSKQQPNSIETQYVLYTRAAFQVHIPHTVSTCIYWLSGTSIAAGTAGGSLAIWTLTRPDAFPRTPVSSPSEDQQRSPIPWFYKHVADTLIISVSSGYPSRPSFVSLTSADGFAKLIDIRSPDADTANTARARIFSLKQAWHEHTQSFLMPDEVYSLRNNTIRRYYSNIHNMRSEAQIVCVATSPVHPCVLIGSADGKVLANNPIARVLNYKEIPWQQTWFAHEWRPSVDKLPLPVKQDTDAVMVSEVPPEVLAQPLARMTEGYKVQQTQLQPVKPGMNPDAKEYFKPITIYEEPSCITTVAWNPNLRFGTWAVAGMGDGLLRVEDVGV
jgi:transcription factor C subunit 6